MNLIVTGCAGFIGMHAVEQLLARGDTVFGVDVLTPYYSVALKEARLARLLSHPNFHFHRIDITDAKALQHVFDQANAERVLHLAAQPGVRYSIENPSSYIQNNLVGFANILEACRHTGIAHLVFASSSSVYGGNTKQPFSETDPVDRPVSLYAATKKSNELMAYAYSHLYQLPITGLRYFTVYGPWGRPDMSPMLFAKAILANQPIRVFNHGDMQRDFTFVDDIVEGSLRALDRAPNAQPPYALFNIGHHTPVGLMDYINVLEHVLQRKAILEMVPMQPGDVKATWADTDALKAATGFEPTTTLAQGLERFAAWVQAHPQFIKD